MQEIAEINVTLIPFHSFVRQDGAEAWEISSVVWKKFSLDRIAGINIELSSPKEGVPMIRLKWDI